MNRAVLTAMAAASERKGMAAAGNHQNGTPWSSSTRRWWRFGRRRSEMATAAFGAEAGAGFGPWVFKIADGKKKNLTT